MTDSSCDLHKIYYLAWHGKKIGWRSCLHILALTQSESLQNILLQNDFYLKKLSFYNNIYTLTDPGTVLTRPDILLHLSCTGLDFVFRYIALSRGSAISHSFLLCRGIKHFDLRSSRTLLLCAQVRAIKIWHLRNNDGLWTFFWDKWHPVMVGIAAWMFLDSAMPRPRLFVMTSHLWHLRLNYWQTF